MMSLKQALEALCDHAEQSGDERVETAAALVRIFLRAMFSEGV